MTSKKKNTKEIALEAIAIEHFGACRGRFDTPPE